MNVKYDKKFRLFLELNNDTLCSRRDFCFIIMEYNLSGADLSLHELALVIMIHIRSY